MAGKDITAYTGRLRNLVFYRWKNKNCIRTTPSKIRQTEPTKRLAGIFGKAVRISKFIRAALADILPDHKESKMKLRFNNALYQWLRFYQHREPCMSHFIKGFSFTQKTLPNYLVKKIAVKWFENKVRITLPELAVPADLPVPKGTESVELKFVLAGCNIESLKPVSPKFDQIEFNCASSLPSKVIEFDILATTETLLMVIISVRYKLPDENRWRMVEDEKRRMVEVIGVELVIHPHLSEL
jgi:hypothetical protein